MCSPRYRLVLAWLPSDRWLPMLPGWQREPKCLQVSVDECCEMLF